MLDLLAQGWRQGSVLPIELARELAAFANLTLPLGSGDLLVVLSHDCDICHRDIEKEPWAELLAVREIPQGPAGDMVFMRNPRVLEFVGRLGASERSFRASASERGFAPRGRLAGIAPGAHLITQPPDLLAAWLSNRYIRSAFPDAFNERIDPALKGIARKLKAHGDALYSIYLLMEDEELPLDTPYHLVVRGTMLSGDFAVHERRVQAQLALGGLVAALSGCRGIEVIDDALVSEAEISLDEIRPMKRWNAHDSLSLATERDASSRIDPAS